MTPRVNAPCPMSLAGLVALLMLPTTAVSQRTTLAPPPIDLRGRGTPALLKPKVAFDSAFSLSEIEAARHPELLNGSMKVRRDVAWQILQRLWAPFPPVRAHLDTVRGSDGRTSGYMILEDGENVQGRIPTWMTWYEQEDIAQLYDEMLSRKESIAKGGLLADIEAVLKVHAAKDLQVSINSARLGKTLRQFSFPGSVGPHRTPSTGAIYYSPEYVKHFLANAERIANCDPSAYPAPSPKPLSPGELRPMLGIESVPPSLRPSNPKNVYALCMDNEMPPDAVMVKTAWYPLKRAGLRPGDAGPEAPEPVWIPGLHNTQLDPTMASQLFAGPAGTWIELPWRYPGGGSRDPPGTGYFGQWTVKDEAGNDWVLMGMHVAAKTVRSWLWISLFSQGDNLWGWRGDKTPLYWLFPHVYPPLMVGNMYIYGMCVVSDFTEGDPTPWAQYDRTTNDLTQQLANSLRAVAGVMRNTQWCSNPYIETNMARGNCIGCHQGSPTAFLPTTQIRLQTFNLSDFSFSFASNRAAIIEIRRRHGLGVTRKPEGPTK